MTKLKLSVFLALCTTQFASGAITYISADSVSFTQITGVGAAEFGTSPDNVINGSGLSTTVASLTDANINTVTHVRGFSGSDQHIFADGSLTEAQYDFTFSSSVSLTDIFVWNYSQGDPGSLRNGRGIGSYSIFLDTGSGFGAVADFTGTLGHSQDPHVAQEIDLGALQTGVVGVRILGTQLNNGVGDAGIGLDEVVFRTDTVPEPSGVLLCSLGGLLLMFRRRI